MKFSAQIKAGSKMDEVKREGNSLVIKTKAPAREGKANKAIIKLLAEYFGVPQSAIAIKSGLGSKNKIIEVVGLEKTK